jgi:hypothetical protein
MAPQPPRARLKLVSVSNDAMLLIRFVQVTERARRALERTLRETVDDAVSDGEVFSVKGKKAIAAAWRVVRSECEPVYDPNLMRGHPALPNPWRIPTAPPRDWTERPTIQMARVRHPELGEALAFQSPRYDDDFMIDFRLTLPDAGRWCRFRQDLDSTPVWIVAEYYADRTHAVLDRYFLCQWDEFMAGEEWDVLPPPTETSYPVRRLALQDFQVLGVEAYAGIQDLNAAYRERKEAYLENQIPVEEWLEVEVAYERIRRHHFPEPEVAEPVIAPREILILLRKRFPDDEVDRSRWFHGYNRNLGGVPARLVETADGLARVAAFLELTSALAPGPASPPAP